MRKSYAKIKERIEKSNEDVRNGLPADPWVIEFREKKRKTNIECKSRRTVKYVYPKAAESAKQVKARVKARIAKSNENVRNGLPADPWVIQYREKNNKIKAEWKSRQPKKEPYIPKANSGSFKKGMIGKFHGGERKVLTEEERELSIIRKKQRSKEWRIKNRERDNENKRLKRQNDPSLRLLCNMRKRLSFLLRLNNAKKTTQTLKALGCSMDEFMLHLSERFLEGMTFENYGKWHIDHIIPCNYFDFTIPEQVEKCFHYSNLQPLWAKDNRAKSDKIIHPIQTITNA